MDQAGIYKIILFEDKDLRLFYPDLQNEQLITDFIFNSGKQITLDFNNLVSISQNISIGLNSDLRFNYLLNFVLFDLSETSRSALLNTNARVGWFPLIYFRDGSMKFINEPLSISLIGSNINISHSREVSISTQQNSEYDFFSVIGMPKIEFTYTVGQIFAPQSATGYFSFTATNITTNSGDVTFTMDYGLGGTSDFQTFHFVGNESRTVTFTTNIPYNVSGAKNANVEDDTGDGIYIPYTITATLQDTYNNAMQDIYYNLILPI